MDIEIGGWQSMIFTLLYAHSWFIGMLRSDLLVAQSTSAAWRATQRRHSDSAGCDPESLSGKELRPASLEANGPRRWGRLLA